MGSEDNAGGQPKQSQWIVTVAGGLIIGAILATGWFLLTRSGEESPLPRPVPSIQKLSPTPPVAKAPPLVGHVTIIQRNEGRFPKTFLGAADDIVVGSITDGRLVRTLQGEFCRDLTEPSEHTGLVYFSAKGGSGPHKCSVIMGTPLEGGEPQEIASGLTPSLSPNGRFLFYERREQDCNNSGSQEFVVRDLLNDQEITWTVPRTNIGCLGGPAAWGLDGSFALGDCYEGCVGVAIFDLDRPGAQPKRVVRKPSEQRSDWLLGGPLHRRLDSTVLPMIISPYGREPFIDSPQSTALISMKDSDGTTEFLTEIPSRNVTFDFDFSGEHALLVTTDWFASADEVNHSLFTWSEGRFISLGTGFTQAVW